MKMEVYQKALEKEINIRKEAEYILEKKSLELYNTINELASANKELASQNKKLAFQNEEKDERANELILANQEKEKRTDELAIANTELAYQNEEKDKRADELILANKEKEQRANELVIANRELAFQNKEKGKRADELAVANKELAYQNEEKDDRANELILANKEKEKRAAELAVANAELAYQNEEKDNRADELILANKDKEQRANELAIANVELAFQNKEKEKRASELRVANTELAFQNKEKEKRAHELVIANKELAFQKEVDGYRSEMEHIAHDLTRLIDTANAPIFGIDAHGRINEWNQTSEKITGFTKEEVLGKNLVQTYITEEYRKSVSKILDNALIGKETANYQLPLFTKAGQPVMVLLNSSTRRNTNGKITGVLGVGQDITAQVKQQKEILRVGAEAKAMQSAVDTGWSSIEFTIDGTILKVNDNFMTDLGYSSEDDLVGKHHKIFCDSDYIKSSGYKNFWIQLANGKEQRGEFNRNRKDGSKIWINANYTPVKDGNGNIYKVIEIANDISKMVETRRTASTIAQELRQFIETANAPIFGIDNKGCVNEWNETSEKVTGFKKEEVLGKNLVQTYITENYRESVKKVLDDALVGKETANFEFPLFTKDGKRVMVLLNSSSRKNTNGKIIGVLGVGQDITELVGYRNELELKVNERTLELNQALKKEKSLNELKSRFVSTASHEFRTPLSSISFAAGSIIKYWAKMEPAMIKKKLNKIEDQVLHMTKLLDDILIVGQAEAGKMRNIPLSINLGNFINEIILEVYSSFNKSHEIVLIDTEELKNTAIYIDEKLGRNIFINLIGNAVKYSPDAKKVTVELSSKKGYIIISITDAGIGISKSELENIFKPFSRGENVDLIQGTGLGLSIVKEAVGVIGGKIIVNSTFGNGTSFIVQIPKKIIKYDV
jgi:PAS domain S-box-containing protein